MARAALPFVLVGFLSGCAQVAHKEGLPGVQAMLAERGVPPPEWRDEASAEPAAREAVARLLEQELTPDAAVRVALLSNPRLQATFEELGIAQANLVQAGLLENPVFSGALLFGGVSPTYDLDLFQNLLDALLLPARKRIAAEQYEEVRLRVAGEIYELVAEVRVAFYRLQGAEQVVDVLEAVVEAAEASRELAADIHAAGNASDLQLASEETLLAEVRAELLRARAETVEPREDLREILGLSASAATLRLPHRLPGLPAEDPELGAVLEIARTHRLDLAAARREEAVLAETLETARDWRYLGGVEVGVKTHREQGERNWVSGPSLAFELPVFDQQQGEIAGLEARLRQSVRQSEARELAVAAEVRRAHGRLEAARGLAEHYRGASIPLRRRVVALTQEFYGYMLTGVFDLLEAKRAEIAAYAALVGAVRDYWIAAALLEKAAGAPLAIAATDAAVAFPLAASDAAPAGRPSHSHGGH